MYIHICKPFLGSLLAGIALIILIPLLLTVSVLLVLSTGKSPFFLQTRVGYRGRLFKIIKFKTMNDRKDENGQLLPDEQRLFPLGRFLRSSSLDELPQLINILKGDMAFVGPRPWIPTPDGGIPAQLLPEALLRASRHHRHGPDPRPQRHPLLPPPLL